MIGTAIVGVGQSDYSWSSERPETALALEAIRRALDDAGLEATEVDGVVRASPESTTPFDLVALGVLPALTFTADDPTLGGFAPGLLGLARAAIATGRARVVVSFRAFNGRSSIRLGRPQPGSVDTGRVPRARGTSPIGGEFTAPYGLVSPAHVFGMWARAYMDRYGIDDTRMSQALGAVAMYARRCAGRNPAALLRDKPLDPTSYTASPMVAEPLRKADICLESDGACAVVLTTCERATDCRHPPIYLHDAMQHVFPGYQQLWLTEPHLPPAAPPALVPGMLARLGLVPSDLDILGLYDASSLSIMCDVETIGLCAPGEGVDWVINPAVPFNTSGGQLAEVYLQGMNQIVELVRQLRGEASNQVDGAALGLAGSAALLSAAVLGREPLP